MTFRLVTAAIGLNPTFLFNRDRLTLSLTRVGRVRPRIRLQQSYTSLRKIGDVKLLSHVHCVRNGDSIRKYNRCPLNCVPLGNQDPAICIVNGSLSCRLVTVWPLLGKGIKFRMRRYDLDRHQNSDVTLFFFWRGI